MACNIFLTYASLKSGLVHKHYWYLQHVHMHTHIHFCASYIWDGVPCLAGRGRGATALPHFPPWNLTYIIDYTLTVLVGCVTGCYSCKPDPPTPASWITSSMHSHAQYWKLYAQSELAGLLTAKWWLGSCFQIFNTAYYCIIASFPCLGTRLIA